MCDQAFFFYNRDIMIASESSPVTRKCYLFVYKFCKSLSLGFSFRAAVSEQKHPSRLFTGVHVEKQAGKKLTNKTKKRRQGNGERTRSN